MNDLSLHVLDLGMNAIQADAKTLHITIVEDRPSNRMTVTIQDDGNGMTPQQVQTTQTQPSGSYGRGQGLQKWRQAAKMTGGDVVVHSLLGNGTTVVATFTLDHPRRLPLGQMEDTLLVLLLSIPPLSIRYEHHQDGRCFVFDSKRHLPLCPTDPLYQNTLKQRILEQFKQGTTMIHKEESQ